jgi:hypothetical protein
VAAECLAQCRTPHIEVMENVAQYDGGRIVGFEQRWSKRPTLQTALDLVVEESIACDAELVEEIMIQREKSVLLEDGLRVSDMKLRRAMANVPLPTDAKVMSALLLSRPPELSVLARNMTGKWGKVTHVAMAKYLGWENKRASAAMAELNEFVKSRNKNRVAQPHGVPQQQ